MMDSEAGKKGMITMDKTLSLLAQIAHGLSEQFGSSCEIVIHDLSQHMNNSIAYIENGQVTNRRQGDGPSGIVLETLSRDPSQIRDRLSYLTKTDDGRILKSSTMYIRGEDGRISYIFSLNYDITALLTVDNALQALITTDAPSQSSRQPAPDKQPQKITHNVNELLDALIEQALALIGKPVALMNKDEKVQIVQYLNNAGAFLITKSGDKIANLLNISKFTLYSYMDAGK